MTELPIFADQRRAMSLKAACVRSGLSERTIYRLIEAGSLKSIKIGRRRLIITASLDQLIDEAVNEATRS